MKKSRLGRGLDSLIPSESAIKPSDVQQVAVDAITPNPHQPRTHFAKEQLAELAESIRTYGIIQPLIVKEAGGGRFILIAGERRLQAAKLAGLPSVPVVSREASDQDLVELALVENVQREDLSPLETAEAYEHMHTAFKMSHEEIARRVGKSRVAITNTLGLLELSEAVKKALLNDEISEGHARALKALGSAQAQSAALRTVTEQGLSVRQTEELVRKLRGVKPKKASKGGQSAEIRDLQDELRSALGTKVNLQHSRKGGRITVFYYSNEELDSLVTRLTKRK